jgi:diguanylate cyclase (GGDEF)-like protein
MGINMTWDGHEKVVEIEDFVAAVDEAVHGDAVAICLTDLDRFQALNDELGRDAGDAVLAAWVRTLTGSLPAGAVVRRLGGDEFAVALPGATAESALIVLDEIREHLAKHPVEGVGRAVAATFGVAARPPHATGTADLVRCANAALMRGKRDGGGRVALYVEEKMVLKSNYYPRADLDRLARLSAATSRTEASLLREALDDLFSKLASAS